MTAPLRAADFAAGLGVNAPLANLNSASRAGQAVAAMDYLGFGLVRAPLTASLLQPGSVADRLAAAGVRFDVLLGGFRPLGDSLGTAASFAAAHPGSVTAIEGPNEINNWPITFASQSGTAAGIGFVDAAAAGMKAAGLAGLALYDFTGAARSAATMADAATHANIHPYPQAGDQPYEWLRAAAMSHAAPGKGLVITESGYTTTFGAAGFEGVDLQTQAKLTLNLIADAALLGAEKTFLYQLFDSPTAGTADAGFGLFTRDGTAKPVAVALHNLTTILHDPAADAATATVHDLAYAVSGLPAGAHTLLVEKAGGTYELMIWAEPDIWDEAANRPIAVAGQTVTVSLGGTARLAVYDPLASSAPLATSTGSTVSLTLGDHLMVVEIAGLPTGAVVAPARIDAPIQLSGSAAGDLLAGGGGDDVLSGLGGADTLHAGLGDDRLTGGAGADQLWGGGGADIFIFRTSAESTPGLAGRDTIMDFSAREGDRIDLSAIDASARALGNQAFVLSGDHFTKHAGQLIQTVVDHQLLVQGDLNGDGRADFAFVLDHVDHPLGAGAFIL